MQHLNRKAFIASAVMVVLTAAATAWLFRSAVAQTILTNKRQNEYKAACVDDLIERTMTVSDTSYNQYISRMDSWNMLMRDAMGSLIEAGLLTEPSLFQNGIVVRKKGDEILLPEELPDTFFFEGEDALKALFDDPDLEALTNVLPDETWEEPAEVILKGIQINSDWYFISWSDTQEYYAYSDSYINFSELVPVLEESFDSAVLILDPSDKSLTLETVSSVFPDAKSAADIGLTADMLEKKKSTLSAPDGTNYSCTYHKLRDLEYMAVILEPLDEEIRFDNLLIGLLIGIMLLIFIPLIVWHIESQRFVRDRILPAQMEKKYAPRRMRSLTVAIWLVGSLAILAFSIFIRSIGILRNYADNSTQTLEILFERIEENAKNSGENISRFDMEWMIASASLAAGLVTEYPEFLTQEMLQTFAADLGADYIMVFDQAGDETLSSNSYSAFTLSMLKNASGTDFPYLLNGVSEMISEPVSSSLTGESHQLVGVTLKSGDASMKNGALVAAFPREDEAAQTTEDTIADLLNALVPEEDFFLAFEEESGKVLYSNDAELTGFTTKDLGIPDATLTDTFMDFFHIHGVSCYGRSMKRDAIIYTYAVPTAGMFDGFLSFGIMTVAVFTGIFLVLSLILLSGYTNQVFREWEVVGETTANMNATEVITADGRKRRSVDPTRRWAFSRSRWKDLFPDQKVRAIITALVLLFLAGSAALLLTINEGTRRSSLIYFVMNGSWGRGLNLFGVFAVLLVIAISCVIVTASRIFLQFLCRFLGTKGETVCRLIFNLIQYTVVFAALYFGFAYLGFDTSTVLASIGLISLALSLGARDIVADMLSGLSIVFEGEFQVGDIIEIEGYRGSVQEIGVRTTKIIGRGDNIKIVRNSEIKNVVNMTRLNSWYAMDITILSSEPLPDLEEMLNRELPKIGEKNKQIISGPFYRGVTAFTNDTMTISISTECKEQNYTAVQRYVNKEVRLLLGREQIPMK